MPHHSSDKHKEAVREANRKRAGFKHSDEAKAAIGKTRAKYVLDKHPNWKGGKSFEEYPQQWTKTLKRAIRERDNYTCRLCSILQGDYAFDVHHIDYDKHNCDPINLITLCRPCHMKTNYRRDVWVNFFKELLTSGLTTNTS